MNNIDKLFKDGLGQASQSPPGYLWGRIGDSLGAVAGRQRKLLIWYAAASIAIMGAFTSGYYIATLNSTTNGGVAENDLFESPLDGSNIKIENKATLTDAKKYQEKIPGKQHDIIVNESKVVNEPPVHFTAAKSVSTEDAFKAKPAEQINLNKSQKIAQVENIKEYVSPKDSQLVINEKIEKEIPKSLIIPPIDLPKRNKWIIGGSVGPQYAYREVKNHGSNIFLLAGSVPDNFSARNSLSDKSYYDQIESPIIAFSVGMNVQYHAAKRLFVESGLYYSRIGQMTEEMFVYEESNYGNAGAEYEIINSSAGDVINNQRTGMLLDDLQESHTYVLNQGADGSLLYMNSSNLVLNFDYLEVPLIVKYKILDKKFDLLISAGISSGILVRNNAYVQNGKESFSLGYTENLRTMSYNSSTGIEIQYELNDRFAFKVEPIFRYALRTISSDYYIRSYPYSFQVVSGLNYSF